MNLDKQGRGAVYGLQIEANREKEDKREFDLSDIDRDRTDQNYYLKKTQNWSKEITRQIKQAGVKERKDAVVLITGVYTASPEWFDTHTREEMERYFEDCMSFHVKEFCQGNDERLLNAVVHLDETTPHLQIASIPLIIDEKGEHLSAKIILGNRSTYRLRQDRFFEEVGRKYEMERGERRDPTQIKEHTTKREWQIATQEARLEEAKEKVQEVQNELKEAREKAAPQIAAFKTISEAARTKTKPTIEIECEEVRDGLLRTHEEFYIKVPCKDEKEAKHIKNEVQALYEKNFSKEALNELINSKNEDLKKKQRKLAREQREFEKEKESQIAELEEERAEILNESRAFNELSLEQMGISGQDFINISKDSLTEALVSETVHKTLDILEDRKLLKRRPDRISEQSIASKIFSSLGERLYEFVDKVREHIVEKLFRQTRAQSRDNNISYDDFVR